MSATVFTALCLTAVAVLLAAEFKRSPLARAIFKTLASLAFVAVALALDASSSVYGQLIVGALVLSLVGDVLLLSDREAAFLAGLGAFLVSHAGYAAAFMAGGISLQAAAAAGAVSLVLGALVVRWLWPRLGSAFRVPVVLYVAVILAMCSLAVGHAGSTGRWSVALGALLFAASDLAVAREKFVAASAVNKAWGLPTYYAAQLLLAWSVATAA